MFKDNKWVFTICIIRARVRLARLFLATSLYILSSARCIPSMLMMFRHLFISMEFILQNFSICNGRIANDEGFRPVSTSIGPSSFSCLILPRSSNGDWFMLFCIKSLFPAFLLQQALIPKSMRARCAIILHTSVQRSCWTMDSTLLWNDVSFTFLRLCSSSTWL